MDLDELRKDFKKFLFVVWKSLFLPKPTKIQYAIADEIQNTQGNLIVEAFRGVGKSWITSAFVVWSLWNNRQLEFLVVSASANRAIEFATFTRRLMMDIPFLNEMLPDKRKGHRDSVLSFDVNGKRPSHAPSVKAAGITGQITGSRADIIIADDVEIPNNSFSVEARQKLLQQTGEFVNILKPGGRIIFLGTPQSQESIYNELQKTQMYKVAVFPALYPGNTEVYNGTLADLIIDDLTKNPELVGKPTDPERFDAVEIEKRRLQLSSVDFQLQYMLDTTLSDVDKYPLKLKDLMVTPLDSEQAPVNLIWSNASKQKLKDIPILGMRDDSFYEPLQPTTEYLPYEFKLMTIDPSGRGKDETAYVIAGVLGTKIYIIDFGGYQGGYDDSTLEALANKARDYKVNKVLIEDNYGDGMFTKLFTPVLLSKHQAAIEGIKNYTNKEKRIIDTLEPVLAQHKLVVNLSAIEKDTTPKTDKEWFEYSLCYQLTHITYEKNSIKHDDRLDALAIAVGYLKGFLGVDEERKLTNLKLRAVEEELEKLFGEDTFSNYNKTKVDLRRKYISSKFKFK